jgi:putative membrane protein
MTPAATGPGVGPSGGDSVPNERTALAWTRTGLALLGSALLAIRVVVERLGPLTAAFAVVALPLAVVVLVGAGRRYRSAHAARSTRARLPDGRLPAGVAILLVILAVTELAFVLSG